MSRNRFIVPDTVKINLSDEEWIEIKKELNAGEERKQSALALVPIMLNGKIVDRVDWSQYELLRAHLWLVNWHLHDAEGNVPPLTLDSLRALDITTFDEINDIIFKHVMETATAKKAVKNPSGTNDAQTSI